VTPTPAPEPSAIHAPAAAVRRATPLTARIAPWTALALAMAAASGAGMKGRHFPERPLAIQSAAPQDALRVWRELDVRGRVLVHLDRPIAISWEPGAAPGDNFVGVAAQENRVRSIYHVIPEAEWAGAQARLTALRDAKRGRRGFRIADMDLPIEILRLSDLPSISEPVLVDADLDRFSLDEQRSIAERLGGPGLRADVVVWRGHPIPELARALDRLR